MLNPKTLSLFFLVFSPALYSLKLRNHGLSPIHDDERFKKRLRDFHYYSGQYRHRQRDFLYHFILPPSPRAWCDLRSTKDLRFWFWFWFMAWCRILVRKILLFHQL
ncbi:hypothetical protein LX32DRAFT_220232 [Colletotrichum zoysiae]|uniref:Secreted protein n=1 Tax=Colletotrichum zoysiae TaxID=1216348 RepID=A0AAD9HNQ2_9PEZI|nr:hypothetical protein LX32DRAFT_220232 [Colletotrichum zoysiae]